MVTCTACEGRPPPCEDKEFRVGDAVSWDTRAVSASEGHPYPGGGWEHGEITAINGPTACIETFYPAYHTKAPINFLHRAVRKCIHCERKIEVRRSDHD